MRISESNAGARGPDPMGRRAVLRLLGGAGVLAVTGAAGCVQSGGPDGQTRAGEAATGTASGSSTERTVTDATGRTVAVPETVADVVAIGPGALNLVAYLDAVSMVVGVEENEHRWGQNNPYNIANPSIQEKPIIGPHKGGDPELIADAEPDLVIATYLTAGAARDLQSTLSRPVVVVKASERPLHQLELFFEDVAFVGDLINRSGRADRLIEFVRSEIETLEERAAAAADAATERAYFAGRSDSGQAGVTSTQHPFGPFAFVDARNVADSVEGHTTVNEETVLTWDPSVIFVSESNLDRVRSALGDPTWQNVSAIQSGEVYGLLPTRFYGNLYGSVLADTYFVGSVLYPDAFADIDPRATAERIYEELLGAPVYDELAERFGGFMRIDIG